MKTKFTLKYNYEINLASESQRRIDFLKQLKLKFNHFSVDIDETQLENESPLNYLKRVVNDKKNGALLMLKKSQLSQIVIVADTIVVLGDKILQKPKDKEEARVFLKMLSNKWHNVITGYAISNGKDINVYNFVKTEVLFKSLSEKEIDFYLSDDEYIGKAGAYAIQGLGGFMIEKFKGSYSNVVGLPVMQVFSDLQKYKIIEF